MILAQQLKGYKMKTLNFLNRTASIFSFFLSLFATAHFTSCYAAEEAQQNSIELVSLTASDKPKEHTAEDDLKNKALEMALVRENRPKLVKTLLESKATFDEKESSGEYGSILRWPISQEDFPGSKAVVRLLVQHKANVNLANGAPLRKACECGNLGAIKILLESRADPDPGAGHNSPLKTCIHNFRDARRGMPAYYDSTISIPLYQLWNFTMCQVQDSKRINCVKQLLKHGAQVHDRDIISALWAGSLRLFKVVLQSKGNLSEPTKYFLTESLSRINGSIRDNGNPLVRMEYARQRRALDRFVADLIGNVDPEERRKIFHTWKRIQDELQFHHHLRGQTQTNPLYLLPPP